jgi:2'-5' RNA ligase
LKTAIFFIAIIPNAEICSEVKAFKEYVLDHYGSGHALRSPAHITLQPPFKWEIEQLPILEDALNSFTEKQLAFSVELSGFDVFSPKVIFVDIVKNKLLQHFQNELANFLRSEFNLQSDRPDRAFHPHMTIAFKDLRKEMFTNAWAYFSRIPYRREFFANRICLLQHNGKTWEERTYFEMKNE